jgi:hypothetical protein
MNLSEILLQVRHSLDELDSDASHWSDTRLEMFINWGVRDVATRLPPQAVPQLHAWFEQNMSIGVSEYVLPSDLIALVHVLLRYATPESYGEHYLPATPADESMRYAFIYNPFYEPTIKLPYYIVGENEITIFPEPESLSVDGIRMMYIKTPTELTEMFHIPELPEFAHDFVALYAVYRALLEDGDARSKDIFAEYAAKFAKEA